MTSSLAMTCVGLMRSSCTKLLALHTNTNQHISSRLAPHLQHNTISSRSFATKVATATSSPPNSNDPLAHDDFFNVKELASVLELYKARVHFGHTKGNRNVHMKPYLYGNRMGVDIIDLNKTLTHMQLALNFLAHMSYRNAVILFVMESSQHGHRVEKAAINCGEYAHTRQWSTGLFANEKLGPESTTRYPDVCVFLSTMSGSYREHPGVAECAKMGIATVGVVDTNVNPSIVTYPIPGNDDSTPSIIHYLNLFSEAIKAGKKRRRLDELEKKFGKRGEFLQSENEQDGTEHLKSEAVEQDALESEQESADTKLETNGEDIKTTIEEESSKSGSKKDNEKDV